MPPRLALRLAQPALQTPSIPISSFLLPFLHNQSRHASILNELSNIPESYSKNIRKGLGPSSGKGKTAGRGASGQKKQGKVPKGFTGGQTKEEISHGKFGFVNVHSIEMSPVNLSRIQDWINQGRLNPNQPITLKELTASRAIHGIKDGIKLLADGASSLTTPINIVVSRASQAAIAAVEALGGTVTTRYYTPQAIKRIRTGKMHPYISLKWDPLALDKPTLLPPPTSKYDVTTPEHRVTGLGFPYRLPDPSGRKDIEYYRDPKNRGYLSHTVKEGESPSLYFKIPLSEEEIKKLKKKSGTSPDAKRKEENKLW